MLGWDILPSPTNHPSMLCNFTFVLADTAKTEFPSTLEAKYFSSVFVVLVDDLNLDPHVWHRLRGILQKVIVHILLINEVCNYFVLYSIF